MEAHALGLDLGDLVRRVHAFRDLAARRTTTQVQYRNVRSANGTMLEGKKYTYDALGNITRISQSTKPFYTLVAYEYDAQNQLTKETYYDGEGTAAGNITRTISYTYDTAGNILSVTETAGDKTTTKAYTYGDSEWLDLLTAINGSAIRYDAGGNPTNWNNGKADLSLQWANGRRLTGASSESATKSESLSYAYDADGVRTSKSYTVLPVYTVTFVADSQTVKTMSVKDGYVLQDRDYPPVPEKSGYAGSWTKYTAAIHENITIQAVYSTGTHTVKLLGLRLIVIKTMTVEDGYVLKRSDYPAVPKKNGFIGKWNTYDDPIHSNITISATYVRDDGTMSLEETEEYDLGSDGGAAAGSDISKPVIYRVVTHEYLTQSGKVMRETVTTNQTVTAVMDFVYDESGKPFALVDQLSAQPNTYYYVLNLQGDVVKLVTESGAVAASYEYDAWGNILASSGSMAEKNPLRYRGYYYDSETGFYYLQSRYYDPTNHRFINADVYASTGQGFAGLNMFSYCYDNPVTGYDPSGCRPSWERQYGNGLVEYTDTGTGTRYTVGCAPIYTQVYGSNNPNDPNCYAYAMGSSRNEQPGAESNLYPSDYSDVYDVAASVIADFRAKGRTARKINGPYSPICADEYRIALRVGTEPYGWYYGKNGNTDSSVNIMTHSCIF